MMPLPGESIMKQIIPYVIMLTAIICLPASATIINVPDNYPTIQQGIDASSDGDTVLVQPGTYVENINFNGHNIVLGSLFLTTGDTTYIAETVIDGNDAGSVLTFIAEEDSTAMINGFTIEHGENYSGGGIRCIGSNPVICDNIIKNNLALDSGGAGIYCVEASPKIINNIIEFNTTETQGLSAAGGIYCRFSSNPLILGNIISLNSTNTSGGGINCSNSSNPLIIKNIITENFSYFSGGGN
jgi:hypothetical protein